MREQDTTINEFEQVIVNWKLVCEWLTNPNLLLWVYPLQSVTQLSSKSKLNPNQYSILFTTKCHCIISTWFEEATNSLLALATFISARGGDSLSCYLPWRELWRVENSTQKKLARIPSDSTQRPERYHEFQCHSRCFQLASMIFLMILFDDTLEVGMQLRVPNTQEK